jgi:hypothetical protein
MAQKAHLIIIVHGIGQHDLKKRTRYLNLIKDNMSKLIGNKFSADQPVEFQFTEWHSTLKEFRDTVAQDLTVPKGFQLLKKVMSDVLSDALFYAERVHRDRIVRTVIGQINEIVKDFEKRFQNHDVQVNYSTFVESYHLVMTQETGRCTCSGTRWAALLLTISFLSAVVLPRLPKTHPV